MDGKRRGLNGPAPSRQGRLPRFLSLGHAVADAALDEQVGGVGRVVLELDAKSSHEGADNAHIPGVGRTPDPSQQLVVGDHASGVDGQLEEQVVLGGGQVQGILRSQAENIWAIGVAGLAPHPVIVRDDLKNGPRDGYWGWDSRWSYPCYPETWYLEPNAG